MPRDRRVALVFGLVTLAACSSSSKATSFRDAACPAVMRWADDAVTAVNEFQEKSPTLADATARRAAYEATFVTLDGIVARLGQAFDGLPYPPKDGPALESLLNGAVARARAEYADDLAQAKTLDLDSFAKVSVNNGHLVTGNEKAKAIIFDAVGEIWDRYKLVDENCGRHPPVTVDTAPG